MTVELHDLDLTEDEISVRRLVRSVSESHLRPHARALDESGEFPREAMGIFGDLGLFGIVVPGAYGGGGGSMLMYVITAEEIARSCPATCTSYITQVHSMLPILAQGSEEQKSEWLPRMSRGEVLGAIAITEPDAGTDIHALTTRATRDGGDYVLSGRKMFITNGGVSDVVVVFALTGETARDGLSMFLVDSRSDGFSVDPPLAKCGIRASNTVALNLESVRVPASRRIGPEGVGFTTAVTVLSDARLSTAGQAVGIAQGAWDISYRYVQERQAFGAPVSSLQAVQLRLAEMYGPMVAARLLTYQVARFMDARARTEYSVEAALAKQYCSDVAMDVAGQAVQLMGGYGYMREYHVERYFRDAKITQIYDGTNDVNRLVMVRQLLKRERAT